MNKVKTFDTIAEAKEYGRTCLPSNYSSELIDVGGKNFMLCKTSLFYTDYFAQTALNLIRVLGVILPNNELSLPLTARDIEEKVDMTELKNKILEAFESIAGYSFLVADDTYGG